MVSYGEHGSMSLNIPCKFMYSNYLLVCSTHGFQILIRLDLRGLLLSCPVGAVLLLGLWYSPPVISVSWSSTPVCLISSLSSISSSESSSIGDLVIYSYDSDGDVVPVGIDVACIVEAVLRINSVIKILLVRVCYIHIWF